MDYMQLMGTFLKESTSEIVNVLILIMSFITFWLKINKQMSKQGESIEQINNKIENKYIPIKDDLEKDIDNIPRIESILKSLTENVGANRAFLHLFHNGVSYYSGHSSQFTCEIETITPGTVSVKDDYKSVLSSNYTYLMKKLLKRKSTKAIAVEKIPETHIKERGRFQAMGVRHMAAYPLIDEDKGIILGFIMLEWLYNNPPADDMEILFSMASDSIKGILNV